MSKLVGIFLVFLVNIASAQDIIVQNLSCNIAGQPINTANVERGSESIYLDDETQIVANSSKKAFGITKHVLIAKKGSFSVIAAEAYTMEGQMDLEQSSLMIRGSIRGQSFSCDVALKKIEVPFEF